VTQLLTLLLLGLSVGLDNFAASVAIGLNGIKWFVRLQIAVVFGLSEAGMLVIGLLAGQVAAGWLGGRAGLIGGVALGLTGLYVVAGALR